MTRITHINHKSAPVRWGLLVAVLTLAFGLRVWLLADTNFNWDEGYSLWISRLPVPQLADTTARDVHPPLYYLLLKAGIAAFGSDEFGARFVSVLTGVLTVALAYRFGRALGGAWVGVLTALLFAVSRANIHISQLARMHSLAALFGVLTLWAALRLWNQPADRRALWGVLLGTAGALYSFYLAIMLPLALNLAFVGVWWQRRRDWRLLWAWVVAQAGAALLFAGWALYASRRMFGWSSEAATPPLFFSQFYLTTLTVGRPTFDNLQIVFALLYVLAMCAGVWALWRTRAAWRGGMWLTLSGIFTPAVVVFLLSLPFHDLGRPLAARYMLPLSVCFYGLAAWGVVALWRRRWGVGLGALAVMLAVALWGIHNIADGAMRRDEMHSIAAQLESMRQPNDALVLHHDKTWTTLAALYTGDFFGTPQGETYSPAYAQTLLAPIRERAPLVWLIVTPSTLVNDPAATVRDALALDSLASAHWQYDEHSLWAFAYTPARAATLHTLAEGAPIPREHANPAQNLAGVYRPFERYPVGNGVHLALYWTQPPPDFTLTQTHTRSGAQIHHSFSAPPPADGTLRQALTLPQPSGTPSGRYALTLHVNGQAHPLGTFTLVDFQTDAYTDASAVRVALNLRYGEHILLLGTDAAPTRARGGDTLPLTLYWQTEQPLDTRYKVSVFLLGEQLNPQTGNPLWGQVDGEPRDWTLPTTQWQPNRVIADPYRLPIPAHTPSGTYTLGVVLYDALSGERLPVAGGDIGFLGQVQVR